ncbi:MAG: sugar ABC transporter permease [Burkholderiales bacterium]|nr:sugar ABC transporter permease [Anaerolineae bacterium]
MNVEQPLAKPLAPRTTSFNPITFLGNLSETRYWAYLLILPSLILVSVVVIYPVLSGIRMSFFELRLNRPDLGNEFLGIEHYVDLLNDRTFKVALTNTFWWVVGGVTSQFTLGLIVALALNQALRGFRLARVLVMLPWVMPVVIAGNIWALMLDSRLGVINDILVKLGVLTEYRAWFSDPNTAMPTVLVVALWQSFPFFTLLLLAGLQGISDDLYEASAVDGANPVQKFWYITLPLLKPIIITTVVLRVIGMVNSPDLLMILTNGGPGHATQTLSLYAFQTAYLRFDFGVSGAISVVMLLLLMLFTVVYVRVSGAMKE